MTTGTTAAFASAEQGRDIQESLIEYVATFVGSQSGSNFSPHVSTGVGRLAYLEEMLAEPFEALRLTRGSCDLQLGTFGTAQKLLKALPFTDDTLPCERTSLYGRSLILLLYYRSGLGSSLRINPMRTSSMLFRHRYRK